MIAFYVSADFELSTKPEWLDNFRRKYDEPYEYHITLKNETYTSMENVETLGEILGKIVSQYNPFTVTFKNIYHDKTPKGEVIMIKAEENKTLLELQKTVRESLKAFGPHVKAHHKAFEDNFNPHITIARHLSEEQFISAIQEVGESTICEAIIDKVVLTTTEEKNGTEIPESIRQRTFHLCE
jgi:2'-5' RNA ligase